MPRAKKDSQPFSIRMDKATFDRLTAYCERIGQAKTIAIERAVNLYIDEYEKKEKIISEVKKGNR